MTPAELREIGERLHGPRWQSKLARALPVNPRTVRRWLSGEREIHEGMAERIRELSNRDYLYEKDGSYNPRMVKKILKAMKSKPAKVFSGPTAAEDMLKWLNEPEG